MLLAAFTAACAHISDYDPATYQTLTELKAETMVLMEDLEAGKPYDDQMKTRGQALRLRLEKAHEYEKGKSKNVDTVEQLGEVKKMSLGVLGMLDKNGRVSPDYVVEKKEQLAEAFDMTIKTERLKLEKK